MPPSRRHVDIDGFRALDAPAAAARRAGRSRHLAARVALRARPARNDLTEDRPLRRAELAGPAAPRAAGLEGAGLARRPAPALARPHDLDTDLLRRAEHGLFECKVHLERQV